MAEGERAADALTRYHERARRRGVRPIVYWIARAILQPAILILWRPARHGREHIPRSGPLILAANHRSFLDPFIVGICVRRPVYFVAKQELFEKRWQAWILNALGAFPVRRGESDQEMMRTAREIVERGDAVVIFPEGTRIRNGSLGSPKRGVGRLALETGAPVVPIAIAGTENARSSGLRIRPVKIKARLGRPLTFPRVEDPSPSLAAEVTARIWPCVELQWEWLGGLTPLHQVAIVGAGEVGTALAVLLGRAGLDVQLGCRTARQAEDLLRTSSAPVGGTMAELPDSVTPCTVADIEFAGADLVVFAVPLRTLPAVINKVGPSIGERATLLIPARGEIRSHAALPARYAAERTAASTVALLGVSGTAESLLRPGARVELVCENSDRCRQLEPVLAAAEVELTAPREPRTAAAARRVA